MRLSDKQIFIRIWVQLVEKSLHFGFDLFPLPPHTQLYSVSKLVNEMYVGCTGCYFKFIVWKILSFKTYTTPTRRASDKTFILYEKLFFHSAKNNVILFCFVLHNKKFRKIITPKTFLSKNRQWVNNIEKKKEKNINFRNGILFYNPLFQQKVFLGALVARLGVGLTFVLYTT